LKKAINIIIALLLVITMAIEVTNLSTIDVIPYAIMIYSVLGILMAVLILYYNFLGYKKPHGNMLRYGFLLFGSFLIIRIAADNTFSVGTLIITVAGIMSVYMSGRLNKIEKNKYLVVVVLILLVVHIIIKEIHIGPVLFSENIVADALTAAPEMVGAKPDGITGVCLILRSLGIVFQWIALSLAYISRYKAHKEAGLLDKAES